MRYLKFVLIGLWMGVLLAACAPAAQGTPAAPKPAITPTLCPTPVGAKSEACALNPGATAQSTSAGLGPVGPKPAETSSADSIEVKPLNLNQPGDMLRFQVTFSSPATDAAMDLSKLAVLTSDNGLTAQPAAWKPAAGGGELSFLSSVNGSPFLANAKSVTLTIKGVNGETPEHSFSWPVSH